MLRQRGVETVILAGADTHGIMRGKRVPIAELDRAAERGVALCDGETLLRYGLAVEACNPEAGPGQFEINLRAAPALQAADEAFLLKSAVKEVAARQELLATFMAKPRSDWPGSSCHLHLSLRESTSPTMRHFIGGLLEGMAELTAIFAPTPNSYRRFVPYSWAGTTATWSVDNRSAGLRDGAARPLPATLGEATDLLEHSALARDWLGDDVVEHCVAMRRAELAAQAAAVTDWETSRYLEAL